MPERRDLQRFTHLILDATYFHKDGCFMTVMNAADQTTLSAIYIPKEGYKEAARWFSTLNQRGLNPLALTSDGERSVLRAFQETWPSAKIQRCLYHIQHEGCRWLRSHPKTNAARTLRGLLKDLCTIRSVKEQNNFINAYKAWLAHYRVFVSSLPKTEKANIDLTLFEYFTRNDIFSGASE